MADVYEQNLPQKTNLTTNDYVRVVGSDDVSYKQPLSDVAQKTIENYAGSTLAGSTQSVKGAIDGLKSSATADKAELNASINEVASDLASESSTRASQDTNLQAQINQLVAPTGTAPNPAEIENARIGADNVTYTTLGDAIRTQVSDLKSDINEISPSASQYDLTDKTLWINGKYISPDSGNILNNATYSATDYMKIIGSEGYVLKRNCPIYGAYYDADKVYIPEIIQDNGYESFPKDLITPSNAVYIRLSCPTANIDSLSLSINKRVELNDNINQINAYKKELDAIIPNIDEFDKLKNAVWNSKLYIAPDNGKGGANNAYSFTGFIPIKPNTEYVLTRQNNVYGAFYDSGKSFISGITEQGTDRESKVITTPSNASFFRLSCPTTNIADVSFTINQIKQLSPSIYVEPDIHTNVITVSTDGSKDFTSLRSALESITDSSKTNRYIVEFYGDGNTYEITNDFTASEIANNNVGLMVPEYTTLRGIGGWDKCRLQATLTQSQSNRYFSAINLKRSSSLENLRIAGIYTRNVVHQDWGTETDAESHIENCELIGVNLFLAYVLASGILSGCTYKYKNTIFNNQTVDVEGQCYSCHNGEGFANTAFLEFDNCRFEKQGTQWSFRLGSMTNNANGINCFCTLRGCKIPIELMLNEENASAFGRGILWKVNGYANDIDKVKIYATDGIDYSGNIDLI